jgi:PAS domain S-box-containing protein
MGTGMTLSLRRRDGAEVPVEISLAPMPADGVPMTFASVRDVAEIRAQDHARRRLLHMLDLDPDAVWVVDADTARITYANSGASSLLGYSREELLSKHVHDVAADVGKWEDMRREGTIAGSAQLTRKDGTIVEFRYVAGSTVVAGMPVYVSVGAEA